MPSIEFGDFATWIAAVAAIASAIAAARSSKAAEKQQQEATRHAISNAEILEKEHDLKLREWTDQFFSSVRMWAEEVCLAISEATHISEHSELSAEHKRPVLIKLSALVDTGRWYFPNQWVDDYGTHKEPAYRGVLQPVLDCVVAAYDALKESGPEYDAKSELAMCQREFVSHIQEVLDPRKREQEIKKIILEFEVSERLRMAPGKR
ncbi:hypothetical protein ACFPTX_15200 [Pseudomonas sp. GCM10022188]|uniref:hypothetical protein n=1 Tax=Pseudomonas TaxID=286 RepID=UPI001E4C7BB4|nr:hypothetical protein [Pseudomonas oryzagri]MCC6076271.1 hypothetical protein [Pseudomonas oryzagri]